MLKKLDYCNVEALLRVRDHILSDSEHFYMGGWELSRECGAVRCIAGWALFLNGRTILGKGPIRIMEEAAEILGISWNTACELFNPTASIMRSATAEETAQIIDHFIATGEVNWSFVDISKTSQHFHTT